MFFGDFVEATPSSKCLGDLALYLVIRDLKASDVSDPAKKGQVDFPKSKVILGDRKPLTTRPSVALPPDDFAVMAALQEGKCAQVLREATNELAMLSLLYLKEFLGYPSVMDESSTLLTSHPTPVFWYGLAVGQEFCISVPNPADLLLDNGCSPAEEATTAATTTDVRRRTCR